MAQKKLLQLRSDIRAHYLTNEAEAVQKLIDDLDLSKETRDGLSISGGAGRGAPPCGQSGRYGNLSW